MKHYLKTLEETVRRQWDQKSLCDYEGDSFTYADVATSIEQLPSVRGTAPVGP